MSEIHALGYIVVRGPLAEWRRFGEGVLGAQLVDGPAGELRLRTDERAYRIIVEDGAPGGPTSLAALGFEVANASALDAVVATLAERGIEAAEDRELARSRMVRRLVTFSDLDGNRLEAFYGQATEHQPFVSPRGVRFVTGDLGVGHAFLLSADAVKAAEFYTEVLGFRLSDTIDFGVAEGIFMHCNPRHHSIALATFEGAPPGLGHLMLEVETLEAVGRALDVVQSGPEPETMTIGEHTNDHMTSFYVATPSGFDIEYGWNGRLIDDSDWTVGHYASASTWGHQFSKPPAGGPAEEPAAQSA